MNIENAKKLIALGWDANEVDYIFCNFKPKATGKYKVEIYDIDDLGMDPEDGVWVDRAFFDNEIDLSVILYFCEGLAYVMTVAETGEELGRGILDFSPFEEMEEFEGIPWHWHDRKEIKNMLTPKKKPAIKNTCVSLNCPFIPVCNKYNFTVDRGDKCEIQADILTRAEKLKKEQKKKEKEND